MTKKKLLLKANGRIWIDVQDGAFLGYGRIDLLEKIKELGSIRQAALEMKMSYQQAWQLIDEMNNKSKEPLVISSRGGKGGGKAIITDVGEKAILQFKEFNKAFQIFLTSYTKNLNS